MNENHPAIFVSITLPAKTLQLTFQIFYFFVLSGSIILFLPAAYSHLTILQLVSAVTLIALPYFFTYMTIRSTASVITRENHDREMHRYPYDHAIYQPGQFCRTCRFLKPARSKHCSVCNVCITKHDHHCVWVMNCIGKGNAVYFMAMIASLGIIMNYGAYLAYIITQKVITAEITRQTGNTYQQSRWSADKTWSQYGEFHLWAFAQDFRIGAVGALAFMTAPLAWALFFYHTYLIWAGITTNETSKWADWRDDIADGIVFKTKRSTNRQDARDTQIEPMIDWPISNTQQLLRNEDYDPQRPWMNGHNEQSIGDGSLRKVKGLDEIENIYDLGFWRNLMDMAPIK